jgi:hypothetical protein
MYFYLILFDYISIIRRREVVLDIGFAVLLAAAVEGFRRHGLLEISLSELGLMDVLAILIGFSVTALTLLTTSETQSIQRAKETMTKRKIRGVPISVYQLAHITTSYTILVQIGTLVLTLFLSCIVPSALPKFLHFGVLVCFFLLLHVFLSILRTVSMFYLIFWKRED